MIKRKLTEKIDLEIKGEVIGVDSKGIIVKDLKDEEKVDLVSYELFTEFIGSEIKLVVSKVDKTEIPLSCEYNGCTECECGCDSDGCNCDEDCNCKTCKDESVCTECECGCGSAGCKCSPECECGTCKGDLF